MSTCLLGNWKLSKQYSARFLGPRCDRDKIGLYHLGGSKWHRARERQESAPERERASAKSASTHCTVGCSNLNLGLKVSDAW